MAPERVIKKYPNRRLYDTGESRYVTLRDIRRLVLEDRPFRVIERQTGADITAGILLQVLAEQEDRAEFPLLTRRALEALIRLQARGTGAERELEAALRGLLQGRAEPAEPASSAAPLRHYDID